MTGLDYILDGLEAELALERELGVRSIEIDRTLLMAPASPVEQASSPAQLRGRVPAVEQASSPAQLRSRAPVVEQASSPAQLREFKIPSNRGGGDASSTTGAGATSSSPALSLAFLHHRALSPAGVEMMAKIITALQLPEGAASVVIAPPRPRAKVYVVLGGLALKMWFPGLTGAPGQWLRTEDGAEVYVTYSPEYILRFKTVTPAVKKIKLEMWQGIKAALKKLPS